MNSELIKKAAGMAAALALVVYIAASAWVVSAATKHFSRAAEAFAEGSAVFSYVGLSGSALEEPFTLLIFGIDTGEWVGGSYRDDAGRADTIVLVKADPLREKASVLSIPRDTLVVIPGRPGDDKINHAYAFGRAELLIAAVELFAGVKVDYYAGLNYRAFKDIVDLLGGVEYTVDRVIECRGMRIEPGRQRLDGDAAFAVISTRQDPMGDIDRVRRQQRFIRAVAKEARERPLNELFLVALAVWKHTDTNVNLLEGLSLARALQGISDSDTTMAVVPGWFYNRDGISYWRAYPEETARLLETLFGETEAEDADSGA